MDTRVTLSGWTLENPVVAASGAFGFGKEYQEYYDINCLGSFSFKGTTLEARVGNPLPRIAECASGMLNAVGLQNPGVEHFIRHELPAMRKLGPAVIANLGGGTIEEYVEGARLLNDADIDMLELNISCPNVREGGANFGLKPAIATQVVSAVRKVFAGPLLVKLSPNAENIVEMAKACRRAGADGISLINTLLGMAIDIEKRQPVFRNIVAGLSGPAVRPVALRMVYDVVRAVDCPVVGLGGIATWQDAVEFLLAGASAIQVGTAVFQNPQAPLEIIDGIRTYMERHGFEHVSEIRLR